jgi:hypothetical protein
MEHVLDSSPTIASSHSVVARGIASAPISLGYFSMLVFWWTPFSSLLATVGLSLGVFSLVRGVRGLHGENFAFAGTCLCVASLSITITLNQALRYLQWEQW